MPLLSDRSASHSRTDDHRQIFGERDVHRQRRDRGDGLRKVEDWIAVDGRFECLAKRSAAGGASIATGTTAIALSSSTSCLDHCCGDLFFELVSKVSRHAASTSPALVTARRK